MPLDPAEVARIVEARIAPARAVQEDLDGLSRDRLVEECEKRGLPTGGIVPTLRARIRRYEQAVADVREDISLESEGTAPRLRNGGSVEGLDRYTSLSPVTRGLDRSAGRVPQWPRPGAAAMNRPDDAPLERSQRSQGAIPKEPVHRGVARAARGSEAPTALTPLEISKWMRQWDIAFSGTKGADADGFVRKVRRLRAMAPVVDRDLLLCLPFYLKGLALS